MTPPTPAIPEHGSTEASEGDTERRERLQRLVNEGREAESNAADQFALEHGSSKDEGRGPLGRARLHRSDQGRST